MKRRTFLKIACLSPISLMLNKDIFAHQSKGFTMRKEPMLRTILYNNQSYTGMNIFYIPMDRSMSVAYLTVNFGGIDTEFTDSSGKNVKFPSGIAHVFEHMLFRRDDFDVMEEFKSLGTASNAFTSYDNTTYTTEFTQSPLKNIEL